MSESEDLQRDRRRFHAHTATCLLGFAGWLFLAAFDRLFVPAAVPWLMLLFSLSVAASGALAIAVGRTFFTGPVDHDPDQPHGDVGDALASPGLHTLDLWPAYTRAVAPYGLFGVGLALAALSGYWVYAGLP